MAVRVRPATPDRWADVQAVFGPRGACEGCWCMFWHQTGREFGVGAGEPNRAALRARVEQGPPPGVLAYADGEPVGWCAVGPRPGYGRLSRSPALRAPDGTGADETVWSVVCFYVVTGRRRQGVAAALLDGAVTYAGQAGARRLEAYPVDTEGARRAGGDLYTGTVGLFAAAGFEVDRRPATGRRLVMSRLLGRPAPAPPAKP